MKTLFLVLFSFSLVSFTRAETFSFDSDLDNWGSWGSGLGAFDPQIGHNKSGSMWLSADWGETQTLHYNWDKLTPGWYQVTAFVRAKDVQSHPDQSTFWHFVDGGRGTENIFMDLKGSYDWRKVQYSIKVEKHSLSLWFRLKSPGQVWIDDVSLLPAESSASLRIDSSRPLAPDQKKKASLERTFKETTLLDFDRVNRPHPFSLIKIDQQQNMGKLSSRTYYNFTPGEYLGGNWSEYDRISLDVYNGNKEFVEIYLTLGDGLSTNYWSQLNHKTHLAPGWNKLNFSLKQYLGERGSHRFNRSLNLKAIRKWFLIIDPNEKFDGNSNFFIDNVKLTRNPFPIPEAGVLAFDFTSHKDVSESGFIKVTSRDLFNSQQGFGFVSPKFWRVEDSQWTNSTLRYSIGLLQGHFRVKLPNGTYKMQLILDRLGYWDTPFWKDRTVYVNGKPIFKESRSHGMDYLKDWLQFEAIVPDQDDHPYELYLKRLFKPIEHSFKVTNGLLDLEFEGDATGISLNSLIIWNTSKNKEAQKFLNAVDDWSKLEFDWLARLIPANVSTTSGEFVTLINPSLTLSPHEIYPAVAQEIKLQGGAGEKPYQFLQLQGDGEASFTLSQFKNEQGKSIDLNQLQFYELIPQYISPDLNHETYLVAGKYLKPLINNKLSLKRGRSTFVMLQLPLGQDYAAGVYQGKLTVKNHKSTREIMVQLKLLKYDLPPVDFPVGFFGPDPVSYSYFDSQELGQLRKKYRHEALAHLGRAGFTTFSGLPEARIIMEGDLWRLDTTLLDEAMTTAMRAGMHKTFFSYGGKFPQQFFDGSLVPSGMDHLDFYRKSSELLSIYLSQPGMPKIIHTFSDEAGGYSDKVEVDMKFAKEVRSFFPFMLLGGFGSKADPKTKELNTFFDYGFYSNISRSQISQMGHGARWGSYNAAPGNLDDPRYTLGPGLFYGRQLGLSHYLEWHASSVNNYPYYDLDGRESDVTMFMPTSDGKLYPTLRFELAVEGLHAYRKLKLLSQLSKTSVHKLKAQAASIWLKSIETGQYSARENILRARRDFNFTSFNSQLNFHLEQLLSSK